MDKLDNLALEARVLLAEMDVILAKLAPNADLEISTEVDISIDDSAEDQS